MFGNWTPPPGRRRRAKKAEGRAEEGGGYPSAAERGLRLVHDVLAFGDVPLRHVGGEAPPAVGALCGARAETAKAVSSGRPPLPGLRHIRDTFAKDLRIRSTHLSQPPLHPPAFEMHQENDLRC